MKIFVKNMVCLRCCAAVEETLNKLNIAYLSVNLGEIDFGELHGLSLHHEQLSLLSGELSKIGFTVLNDKKSRQIEKIKQSCRHYLEQIESPEKKILSEHIQNTLSMDYKYLSNLFSVVEGVTIEQYFLRVRIEKVKEHLLYNDISLKEIAFQLGFSSTAHLSGQFKKLTGLTPSHFKQIKNHKLRLSLDEL